MAEATVPLEQYQELQRKCDDLQTVLKEYRLRLEKATVKLTESRTQIKAWQEYIDRHPKYIQPCSEGSTSPARPMSTEKAAHYQLPNRDSTVRVSEPGAGSPSDHHDNTSRNLSSQTTVADTQLHNTTVKPEPLSDDDFEPIVVSARTLRKPHKTDHIRTLHQRGTHSDPYKIKREDDEPSQTITHIPALTSLAPHTQMSDLDAFAHEIETPRKRQKLSTANAMTAAPTGEEIDVSEDSTTTSEDRFRRSRGPLQPMSTNTPILPRTSEVLSKSSSSKKRKEHLSQRLRDMGEDTSESPLTALPNARKGKRLDSLLQGNSTPNRKEALSREQLSSSRSSRVNWPNTNTPQTATRNIKQELRDASHADTSRTPNTVSRAAPAPSGLGDPPLRDRPLSALTLDDFRINPLHAGTSFAFSTSVRDAASRACLPGCTKPCCAALQLFAPQSPADDDAALHAWLGTADTSHLSAEQRATLVATARAERWSRAHGRHRQVFERAKTPPGFWNTDMPSTQELEEQRAQARRELVEEVGRRWCEAVRADGRGRWRFRDEL